MVFSSIWRSLEDPMGSGQEQKPTRVPNICEILEVVLGFSKSGKSTSSDISIKMRF